MTISQCLGLVAACMLLITTASADPISGTFMGANIDNTTDQDSSDPWFSNPDTFGTWWDHSGAAGTASPAYNIAGNSDSGGYVLGFEDPSLVTTISDLTPNTDYDVNFIWSGVWGHSNDGQGMWVGFAPDSVTQLPSKEGSVTPFGSWVDEASAYHAFKVWEDPIGVTNSGPSGEINVYVNNVNPSPVASYNPLLAYNGVSFSPAAIIGLAGDYNDNGQVEQGDLDLVLLNWGDLVPPAGGSVPAGWTNPDYPPTPDQVDQDDLDGVLLNWGTTAASAASSAAVPEPSFVIMLIGACVPSGAAALRFRPPHV